MSGSDSGPTRERGFSRGRSLARASGWCVVLTLLVSGCGGKKVVVGSKPFAESRTLAEMVRHVAIHEGRRVEHRNFSASWMIWEALKKRMIDIYPDYTGTLRFEILKDVDDLDAHAAQFGLKFSKSLGFQNSYALGMKRSLAERKGIRTISDLRDHPEIRYGMSREFRKRADGWGRLAKHYGLSSESVSTMEHSLSYPAIREGKVDVMDIYTTDGKVKKLDMVVLEDDKGFFPKYEALWVYRPDALPPEVLDRLLRLEGRISEDDMRELNAEVEEGRHTSAQMAVRFLNAEFEDMEMEPVEMTLVEQHLNWASRHLLLVGISLLAAVVVAIPLGVLATKVRWLEQAILSVIGVVQTIPSLAMLMFLLPFFGIGILPTVVALFFYSLLPIVRNTHAGLKEVPHSIKESATALGLSPWARLWLIELPLASRSILAGIKTSAVINVGFATLGAFISAGGYGEPIITGLSLNNRSMILQGALGAAVLALLVQGVFELVERFCTPKGLRIHAS